jgi:hypothetical protein
MRSADSPGTDIAHHSGTFDPVDQPQTVDEGSVSHTSAMPRMPILMAPPARYVNLGVLPSPRSHHSPAIMAMPSRRIAGIACSSGPCCLQPL